MIWRCPKCELPLYDAERSVCCDNNHRYDRAKQGYTYLLLANQKNSRNPGDNDEMIQARRRFLRAGYYQPLVDDLLSIVKTYSHSAVDKRLTALDLGCGEGYYLEEVGQYIAANVPHSSLQCFGVDVSKDAVKKAASSAKQLLHNQKALDRPWVFDYTVASTYHLPVIDSAVDIALNVFAPVAVNEVIRVLADKGIFIRVQPAEHHLDALKQAIYGEAKLHTLHEIEPEFALLERKHCSFAIDLPTAEAIADLLAMTPLHWHGEREAKQALIEKGTLSLQAAFDVQVLTAAAPTEWVL
jgi:Methyltransferase domain.